MKKLLSKIKRAFSPVPDVETGTFRYRQARFAMYISEIQKERGKTK